MRHVFHRTSRRQAARSLPAISHQPLGVSSIWRRRPRSGRHHIRCNIRCLYPFATIAALGYHRMSEPSRGGSSRGRAHDRSRHRADPRAHRHGRVAAGRAPAGRGGAGRRSWAPRATRSVRRCGRWSRRVSWTSGAATARTSRACGRSCCWKASPSPRTCSSPTSLSSSSGSAGSWSRRRPRSPRDMCHAQGLADLGHHLQQMRDAGEPGGARADTTRSSTPWSRAASGNATPGIDAGRRVRPDATSPRLARHRGGGRGRGPSPSTRTSCGRSRRAIRCWRRRPRWSTWRPRRRGCVRSSPTGSWAVDEPPRHARRTRCRPDDLSPGPIAGHRA